MAEKMTENTERLLGSLETSVLSLNGKIDDVLKGQDRIERDYKQSIERVERDYRESIARIEREETSARGRIYQRIENEAGGNQVAFRRFNETLDKLNEHMIRFEATSDLIDSHAQALLDHEKRVKVVEDGKKLVDRHEVVLVKHEDRLRLIEGQVTVVDDLVATGKDIGTRVADIERKQKTVADKAQQNKVWIRWLVAAAGVLETLHMGGGKIMKWIEALTR